MNTTLDYQIEKSARRFMERNEIRYVVNASFEQQLRWWFELHDSAFKRFLARRWDKIVSNKIRKYGGMQ